ncbi:hypothetical protein BDP27DRAFT_1461713 [Rhodocollybia butyracea]|uniref:Uncharacterized protein n=1 Tax=Rhodocollybia butyracea TaxID=206335 RepID=A0A9P5Q4M4_9AGAR|nr:hypothetical protein BDP27DRAFT_1461713 [Rhodocollybia butyracea]
MSGTAPTSYLLPRLIVVMAGCMLYGTYAVLFGLAIWILPRKFHISSIKKFIFPATIVSFILATINIFYDLVGEAYAILYMIPSNEKPWMIAGQAIDFITFLLGDLGTSKDHSPTLVLDHILHEIGRVWWLSREIRRTRYNFKIESGVIYPLFIIIMFSSLLPNWSCLGTIVSGLAPTLIAVRVGLGRRGLASEFAPPQNSTSILDIA